MAIEITIPRQGWSMEEGILVNWLKRDGDFVARGDMLFVLESEKATQEIESLDEGVLHIPPTAAKPGDAVAVGQVIGMLLAKGESIPTPHVGAAKQDPSSPAPPDSAPVVGPAARRLARKKTADLPANQPARRPAAPAVAQASSQSSSVSPRARRAASELGIDLNGLPGTGRDGRVRERDVRAAAKPGPQSHTVNNGRDDGDAASGIRRTIARRMTASRQTTAAVTLTSRADATNLLDLRNQFAAAAESGAIEVVPSITDLIVKLAAFALTEHPRLNARWENERIIDQPDVHIGVAVDTDAGLLVPVVRNASQLRVGRIAALSRDLVARARSGALSAAEQRGGTFTITNLGMYGIDAFTPIINPPETAILGLGAVRREVVFEGVSVVPRDLLTLSLTFDHRVVDGAPAARFLQSLVRAIEHAAAFLA